MRAASDTDCANATTATMMPSLKLLVASVNDGTFGSGRLKQMKTGYTFELRTVNNFSVIL